MAYEFDNELPQQPMPYVGNELAISGNPTYAPALQQQQQARSLAGALGLDDDTIKLIMLIAAVASIGYLIYKLGKSNSGGSGGVKSNPPDGVGSGNVSQPGGHPGGKNRIVDVKQRASGAWYYKLMRKRSRWQGPFASFGDAKASAERRGYAVIDRCKPENC